MQDKIHGFLPVAEVPPTDRQRLVVHYLCAMLIDLVVLNLFDEFSAKVHVASFSWSLLAAVVLQAFLKGTNALVYRIGVFFSTRSGAMMKALRVFCAWLVLFLSKFVILEALDLLLGDRVRFDGALDGLAMLFAVVTVMVVAEEAVVRFVRWVR